MRPILIVDDNPQIVCILSDYAEKENYEVISASGGEEALRLFFEKDPCLVLLDIMLPDLDGMEVLKRIRQVSDTPVLMISAKQEDADRIRGLDDGADDYIVKPFSPGEVMSRVRAALRRAPRENASAVYVNNLALDPAARKAFIGGEELALTSKEWELLYVMAQHPGRVFTRDNLLSLVWGYDHIGNDRAVDTHIKRLRAKLDAHAHPDFSVETVWGMGYRLNKGKK